MAASIFFGFLIRILKINLFIGCTGYSLHTLCIVAESGV